MVRSNQEVRNLIKKSGVRHWMLASQIEVSEQTLCRWLRHELPPEKKQKIIAAVNELRKAVN